jgi:hypothetical protein
MLGPAAVRTQNILPFASPASHFLETGRMEGALRKAVQAFVDLAGVKFLAPETFI